MSNPFDFFDAIYCLSLIGRVDRRDIISKEFEKVGIDKRVSYILGIPEDNAAYSCDKSHAYCLMEAKRNKCKNVLIFEDDAQWIVEDVVGNLEKSIKDLPDDWDLFYLGGTVFTPAKRVTSHLARMHMTASLVSYAVNKQMFEIIAKSITPDDPLDNVVARKIMPNVRSFLAVPPLTTQRPSWSDVQHANADYTDMFMGMYKDNIR